MSHNVLWLQALCLVFVAVLAASVPGADASDEKTSDIKMLQDHFNLIHDIYAAVGAKGAEKEQLNLRLIREAAAGKRMRRSIAIRSADDSQVSAQSEQLTTAAAEDDTDVATTLVTELETEVATQLATDSNATSTGPPTTAATDGVSTSVSGSTDASTMAVTDLVTILEEDSLTTLLDDTNTATETVASTSVSTEVLTTLLDDTNTATETAAVTDSTATSATDMATTVVGTSASASSGTTTKKMTDGTTEPGDSDATVVVTYIEEVEMTTLIDEDDLPTEIVTEIVTELLGTDEASVTTTKATTTPTQTAAPTTTTRATTTPPPMTTGSNVTDNSTQGSTTLAQTTTFWPTTIRIYEPPVAVIEGTASISLCGTLNLNALSSRDSSGDALQYIWSVESTGESTNLEAALNALNGEF